MTRRLDVLAHFKRARKEEPPPLMDRPYVQQWVRTCPVCGERFIADPVALRLGSEPKACGGGVCLKARPSERIRQYHRQYRAENRERLRAYWRERQRLYRARRREAR